MDTIEAVATVKLTKTEYGTIRIGDSRVSLDSVVYHFKLGSTAEEIFHKFPDLDLADIYGAISYYLTKRELVEAYLKEEEIEAEKNAAWAEETFGKQNAELRERILARNAERLRNLGL